MAVASRRPRRRSLAEVRAVADAAVTGQPLEQFHAKAARAPRKNVEEQHGIALMQWAARAEGKYPALRWLHHVPNGGGRSKSEAGRLKAQGVKGGVLDYHLPVTHLYEGDFDAGLYIELKAPDRRGQKFGGMSDDQVRFARFVDDQGYLVCLCYDWQEARAALEAYLSNQPVPHRWSPPA